MKLISKISILISIIGICIAISIQYNLFEGYQNATGKTRALYGIKQLMQLDYVFIGIISFIFSIISVFKKEKIKTIILTLSLSILSVLILVLELWKILQ
ncbi:hypothetical protein QVZ41_14035 [Wenyingzhuangia sp. chi5]|uniref:DUF3784 domain-containing protein n=1 Tax=Wenyingzhuangia gilva TaxID=3057677 RepID=A0ABT8VVH1_9FLAO|nr:hypothetical protein [Wenyingzhuangia sp. chi5]MDO3695967.1 hypothetical protein [Wenyingzhuangia sp. chi5]